MKQYITLIFLFGVLITSKIFAQCPNAFINLTTQSDVDNFPIDYPNCTELLDGMIIGPFISPPSDITDLSPLSQLSSTADKFYIKNNPNLTNLNGLENLVSIGGAFWIEKNVSLTDITALQNCTSVGAATVIRDNIVLSDLTGIENIDFSANENIYIDGNTNLSVCNIENICNHIETGGWISIEDNAPGCDNPVEVGAACGESVLCPPNSLSLDTQAKIDEIAVLYPNCTELISLNIGTLAGTTDIVDLTPLSNITTIQEGLWIGWTQSLTSLAGLHNLTSMGDRFYMRETAVTNMAELSNLTSIGGYITIRYNNSLQNFTGLENLTSVGGYIEIHDNPVLENLSGLQNIDPNTITDLQIHDNPNLSFCSVLSICNYLGMDGLVSELYGNEANCNTTTEILDACSFGNITGNIFSDINIDCIQGTGEPSLDNWLVKVENNEDIQYTYTTQDGSYTMYLDDDNYTVSTIPPNSLWSSTCPEVNIDVAGTDVEVDIGATATALCPLLEVDVTAPIVRRCFDSNYYVRYCNAGTVLTENAYVEVQLDPFFTYQNSTIAGTDLGDNLYSFDLENLDIGECGGFRINVYVDCDSTILGQTHCVEAHIFPDSICTPALPLWDESSIVVDAQCLGDSIEFSIENIGTGDMSDSLEYLVVEDDLIWQRANFQLDSGDDIKFQKAANGEFHRLEAEQSPGHPGNSMPSVFIEGCGEDDNGEFRIGFVNYFLLDEGDAFVSIDCQENVGSYDPNDKQAFPVGYGAPHYITDSTDLEYMIRFQNTGTDTAFNIVIRDTISPHLNIETLRPGVASHDYRYDIEASNIAVFYFENIMLPDSNINEPASHGFIKFDIEQQRNNPIGTHIMNDAAIYFDFNEPIITNTVFHTIGEDFMGIVTSIITPPEVTEAGISVNVFPNPFDEYTQFEVHGKAVNELYLSVYDMMGREVHQQKSINQKYTLFKNNLTPGVYVFRLMDEKQQLATGKLVIE